jgi:hypothetical protein
MMQSLSASWNVIRDEGELHVVPDDEAHLLSDACWCKPSYNEDDGIYVHHSRDRREYTRERQ